jgi:O-antigen ligase
MQRFGLSGLVTVSLLVLVMNLLVDPIVIVTSALGRDVTLTGRTDIWQQVLEVNINPWIGTGYFSFWHPDRAQGISDALGFFFVLKEAHNGYIEAYLNTGLIGLALLAILLLRSVKRSIKLVSGGDSYETFRFAALVVAMLYNVTESAFCSLVVIWFLVLLAMIDLPQFANGRPGVERFAKARKRS